MPGTQVHFTLSNHTQLWKAQKILLKYEKELVSTSTAFGESVVLLRSNKYEREINDGLTGLEACGLLGVPSKGLSLWLCFWQQGAS